MGNSTDGSKHRAMKFLRDERREVSASSSFVRSSEAYGASKWRKKGAHDTSNGSQPSSASIFSELTGLPLDLALPSEAQPEVGRVKASQNLPESNIGFKLLKKSGWKEGSGLGVSEQGRLNPIVAKHKLVRRGIGAERELFKESDGTVQREPSPEVQSRSDLHLWERKPEVLLPSDREQEDVPTSRQNSDERLSKKTKQEMKLTKKALKKQAETERLQEAAFAREFYREFWPENV